MTTTVQKNRSSLHALFGAFVLVAGGCLPAWAAQRFASDASVDRVLQAAIAQTTSRVVYDGSYRRIPYPGGDVPGNIGVCTDVIIRAYRTIGVDLQRLVHEDMRVAFVAYPHLWNLSRPDPNIDHRRVPNLQAFFRREGAALPVSRDPKGYEPGDLVTWMLPGNLPHIGMVTDERSADGDRPLIVHNIGRGPQIEDMLFEYTVTGHYRYRPGNAQSRPSR